MSRRVNMYNIVLKEDTQILEEVVVIGYGTVKKSDLTGSVSTVGKRSFESQPVKSVSQILQGRTPGVEVTTTSGMPGAGARVRVRGTTSINKSSDPLYVIDGIISTSGLDGLNPQDIQSMEILKDASSTAIYGSRGPMASFWSPPVMERQDVPVSISTPKLALRMYARDTSCLMPTNMPKP